MSAPSKGEFVWYDLMTKDVDAAQRFYRSVFGWGTQPFEGGEKPYLMWTVQGSPIGGVMDMSPGLKAPPHWIGYVQVDNVAATCKEAKRLGGTVHQEPTPVPEVGVFAVLTDPQGAAFAVYKPKRAGSPVQSRTGDFSWRELATTDSKAAFDFYSVLLGWQKGEAMDMGEAGIYQLVTLGGTPIVGIYTKPTEMPDPNWLYYALVADLKKAMERVEAGGGMIVYGPQEIPGGDQVAGCTDPQGGAFALHWRSATPT